MISNVEDMKILFNGTSDEAFLLLLRHLKEPLKTFSDLSEKGSEDLIRFKCKDILSDFKMLTDKIYSASVITEKEIDNITEGSMDSINLRVLNIVLDGIMRYGELGKPLEPSKQVKVEPSEMIMNKSEDERLLEDDDVNRLLSGVGEDKKDLSLDDFLNKDLAESTKEAIRESEIDRAIKDFGTLDPRNGSLDDEVFSMDDFEKPNTENVEPLGTLHFRNIIDNLKIDNCVNCKLYRDDESITDSGYDLDEDMGGFTVRAYMNNGMPVSRSERERYPQDFCEDKNRRRMCNYTLDEETWRRMVLTWYRISKGLQEDNGNYTPMLGKIMSTDVRLCKKIKGFKDFMKEEVPECN